MTGILSRRLAAIEKRIGALPTRSRAEDAKAFSDAILRLADRFGEGDASIGEADRCIRFSAAGRLAWALRFGTPDEFEQALDEATEMAG